MSIRKGWAGYDRKVEALLSMGTAGVVESLLRMVACLSGQTGVLEFPVMRKQVHDSSRARHVNASCIGTGQLTLATPHC